MQCRPPAIFLVLYLFAPALAPAQKTVATEQPTAYFFHHLDYTNGLFTNDVFSLAQDKKGYMWIGTGKGLQRYDGLRFFNYPDTSSADRENLRIADIFPDDPHNRILYNQFHNSLKEWKWLGTRHVDLAPGQQWRPGSATVYLDSKGRRWSFQSYFTRDSRKNITEGIALLMEPGKTAPYFVSFARDRSSGETWISAPAAYGLLLLDDIHKTLSAPSADPGNNPLLRLLSADADIVRKFNMDDHGNVWLLTWSQFLYRYNAIDRRLYTYSLGEIIRREGIDQPNAVYATSMLQDNHGRLWIGTAYAGLLEYHFDSDQFTWILHQPANDLTIQYNHEIFTIFQDREENIWLGTDKGISIFNPYHQYFTTLGNRQHTAGQTTETEIDCVMPTAHGGLMIGYWGNGIRFYDNRQQLIDSIYFKGTYDKNLIWCFLKSDDGYTWVGCQHGFVHILDTGNRLLRTLRPAGLERSTVRCLEKDPDGNILLGLHNGKIITWDRKSGQFLSFNGSSSRPLPPIQNIHVDKDGHCWAGTANGLAEFDRKTRSFRGLYTPSPGLPLPFYGMMEYDDSLLLTGIGNAGLYFFNRRNKTFDRLPFRSEEPFWSAYAIRKDSTGNIWFTTDYDVCKYDPVEKKFLTYHPQRGLVNSHFIANLFVAAQPGKWLTWTDNEIVEFSPGLVSASTTIPASVTITGLRVFDKPFFIDSALYANKPVALTYKENFISIQYSFLRFSGFAQTEYYYRLSGVDKEWVHAGARGYANYTNLPPGKYRFQVTTGGNGDTASMDIVIVPPFWATLWFRAICLAVIAGLLYWLIRWRIRSIRRDADMQQQIATTEMMALRAQMNPHFIFNCINSIDSLIQSNDKYHATIYLNKFARLIRNILDSSRQNSIPLSKDLETLRLYIELEQLRNGNTFTAEIKADEEIIREDFKVPPLIVQPYVENAILHGLRNRDDNNGRLVIHVARQRDHLVYTIEDNGVGREASKKDQLRRSYGMEMSSDRVKLFNRQRHAPVTVTDLHDDGEATGTRVEVLLKIQ
jgi:ligand-binding sensor domain-containing protein